MRVLLATTFYPPWSFGGDGVFVARLARALAGAGHDVHVLHEAGAFESLSPLRPTPPPPVPGVTVHTLRTGRLGLLRAHQLGRPSRAVADLVARDDFDVVHFHNVSLLGAPGLLTVPGRAITLCTLHDYWFVCPTHVLWRLDREACEARTCVTCTLHARRPPQAWRWGSGLPEALSRVDAFLTASETSRRLHASNGFPFPIRLLPLFAAPSALTGSLRDTDFAAPSALTGSLRDTDFAAPSAPGGDGLRTDRPYFLYSGRLEKHKGVHVLIEAFRSFRDADLCVAGAGSQESALRAQAADLPHVRFLGARAPSDLHALYAGAVAAVAPSLCYETFGLVPVEAWAARTPAVVPAGGALAELVEGAGGGLVYQDPAGLVEALRTLAGDAGRRRELGEKGHEAYRARFTERAHLDAYHALLDELSAARTPPRGRPR